MKSQEQGQGVPFFARYLEGQEPQRSFPGVQTDVKAGWSPYVTLKYPSDKDELEQTMKAPSDKDEI